MRHFAHLIIKSILCIMLLATMGLDSSAQDDRQPKIIPSESEVISDQAIPRQHAADKTDKPIEQEKPPTIQIQTKTETVAANYEVTAYFLNIRAEANSDSKILDVVPKGTMLEVTEPTENGWLRLKNEGYVHGKYAKYVSGGTQPNDDMIEANKPEAEPNIVQPPESMTKTARTDKPVQPTSTVKSESGLTEEHISKIFEGTSLEGNGLEKVILEIEKEYGINSYFTIAVMKLESGHGKSRIAQVKNNLFGLNATGKNPFQNALSFQTKGESVKKFGQIISDFYLDKGLTSIEKVAQKYCQANPKWPTLVKSIMKGDYKKLT